MTVEAYLSCFDMGNGEMSLISVASGLGGSLIDCVTRIFS